jgi:hypothetical protein
MEKEQQIEEMARAIMNTPPLPMQILGRAQGKRYMIAHHIAEHLYAQDYRKQSGWISVGERLPDGDCLPMNCLVAAKVGDRVVVDWATRGIGWGYLSQKAEAYWEILHDWDEGEGCEITHWMPLPEPPKMKGGETDA